MVKPKSRDRSSRPPVRTTRRHWVAAILICCAALLAVGFYRHRAGYGYPLDDSWIHLAFARNLAEGNGFGVNAHEPTPGATSPLWVLLLSVGFLFGGGAQTWPWLLNGCVLAVCGVLAAGLCRDLQGDRREAWYVLIGSCCCGLATVVWSRQVWSAAGAMEVPLLSLFLLAALRASLRARDGNWKHALGWGVCAGLAANARPEGLLLVPILTGIDLVSGPRKHLLRAAVGATAALLLTVPYSIFCLSTSGRWFPNTYYAKTLGDDPRWPDLEYLQNLSQLAWQIAPEAVLLLPFGLLGLLLWRKERVTLVAVAALAYVFALPLAYSSMQRSFVFVGLAGNFGRYLYPIVPLVLAVGLAGLLRIAAVRPWRFLPIASVGLGMVLLLTSLWGMVKHADIYAHNVRDINRMQVRIALSLKEKLPPNTLVAASDVGALAYLTDLRVLDLIGIISIDVLDVRRPVDRDAPRTRFELAKHFASRRPAAVIMFPSLFPDIFRWLRPGLEVVEDVYVSDNMTSAGNRSIAFRIDWSRIPELPEAAPQRPAP